MDAARFDKRVSSTGRDHVIMCFLYSNLNECTSPHGRSGATALALRLEYERRSCCHSETGNGARIPLQLGLAERSRYFQNFSLFL